MGMAKQSTQGSVPVLITRPDAQARAFAAALTARFGARVRPVIAPLMAPVLLAPDLPGGPFAAVIFTSATGVMAAKGLAAKGLALPKRAFCVGRQTAVQAQAAGFEAVSADGNADSLLAMVVADPPAGRILHLRGEATAGDVAERLQSAGIETVSVVAYRQEPRPLTAEALALLAGKGAVIVPLFSPRSAALFQAALHKAALPGRVRADLWLAALSEAVGNELGKIGFKIGGSPAPEKLQIALRPDAEAMLDAVGQLLELSCAP